MGSGAAEGWLILDSTRTMHAEATFKPPAFLHGPLAYRVMFS